MKKLMTLAAVVSLSAGAAFAGGYDAPAVEAEPIVVENGSSSSAGLIVPALLVLGVLAAASSGT
ncbi:MAG: hypothetical protein WBC68_13400 [Albidovulum sp.]